MKWEWTEVQSSAVRPVFPSNDQTSLQVQHISTRYTVLNYEMGMNGSSDFGWKTGLLSEHFYENQRKCPVDVWWWLLSRRSRGRLSRKYLVIPVECSALQEAKFFKWNHLLCTRISFSWVSSVFERILMHASRSTHHLHIIIHFVVPSFHCFISWWLLLQFIILLVNAHCTW